MLCFITNKNGAESSKILNIFSHAPLFTRDDDRLYFPGLCGVLESTMGHSLQASATTFPHVSLFTKGDDSAKTVPVRCCSDGRVLGLFVPLPPAVLTGFPQGASISLQAGFGELSFSVLCSSCFTHGTKHLDSCSTFHKAVVTSRAFPSHFVSWF